MPILHFRVTALLRKWNRIIYFVAVTENPYQTYIKFLKKSFSIHAKNLNSNVRVFGFTQSSVFSSFEIEFDVRSDTI